MLTPRGPFNDEGLKPYDPLKSVLRSDRAGGKYDFDDSLRALVQDMESTLDDIAQGEWNGMPIKDPARIPEYLQLALKPILETAVDTMRSVNLNSGFGKLSIDFDDRAGFRGTQHIDLNRVDDILTEGVNTWLRFVQQQGHAETTGVPLAINSRFRNDLLGGIDGISDVLTTDLNGDHTPISFINSAEARERIIKNVRDTADARAALAAKSAPA